MSPESDGEGAIRRLRTAALQAFGGDAERAETWLWSDNGGLGGMTPFRAAMSGRLADALDAAGNDGAMRAAAEDIANIVEKVAGRDGGRCDECDEFLERAAELVECQVSCECEGFCECYGRDTLLGLAERIRAMKGGGR